jgi:hypothetical protein
MVSMLVFTTVVLVLVLGVALGYGAATGILKLLGTRTAQDASSARLRAAEVGSGGD